MHDPGLPGALSVSIDEHYWFISQTDPKVICEGQLYSSGAKGPLVLIFPFDYGGQNGPNWLQYKALGRHLASYGFNVATSSRKKGLSSDIILQETFSYLYGGKKNIMSPLSKFGNKLENKDELFEAVIGHSHGGSDMIHFSRLVRKPSLNWVTPRDLKSLVLLAPSFGPGKDDYYQNFSPLVPQFDSSTDSFLGISVTHDADNNAYGKKRLDQPMLSNFLMYDTFGSSFNELDWSSVEKDMIFAHGDTSPVPYSHGMQDKKFVLAYVAAFLRKHVKGDIIYDSIFKLQIRPPSLASVKLWQQHEERSRIGVFDGDQKSTFFKSLQASPEGIHLTTSIAWQKDQYSPHLSKQLKVYWLRSSPNQGPNWFSIELNDLDVSSCRFLSFRLGQVFIGAGKPAVDMRIVLDNIASPIVLLSNHGGKIHFPVTTGFHDTMVLPAVFRNTTKSAMRTYVIPLSAFNNTGIFKSLKSIKFVLSDDKLKSNGDSSAVLCLDTVAFWPE